MKSKEKTRNSLFKKKQKNFKATTSSRSPPCSFSTSRGRISGSCSRTTWLPSALSSTRCTSSKKEKGKKRREKEKKRREKGKKRREKGNRREERRRRREERRRTEEKTREREREREVKKTLTPPFAPSLLSHLPPSAQKKKKKNTKKKKKKKKKKNSFTRVGVMVFLCHDVNDIFLEAAKLARYARTQTAPTALFVLFALSWFVSRLFYFPKYIIASVWVDPVELVAKPNNIDTQPHWGFLVGLLCFLLVLHAYWSVLILRVIARNLREGQPDDVRESDSEGEEDEDEGEGARKTRAARKKRA